MLLCLIYRQVAGGRATRINGRTHGSQFTIGRYLVGKNLSIVFNIFGALLQVKTTKVKYIQVLVFVRVKMLPCSIGQTRAARTRNCTTYRVNHVKTWMKARKGWVDHYFRITLHVQERQGSIRRVETIHIERMFGFGSTRAVGQLGKVTVNRQSINS